MFDFDLLWKDGDARRFVSLKCYFTKNAQERALLNYRDVFQVQNKKVGLAKVLTDFWQ